jgi:palmitoyl-protein thioesterase
VNPDEPVPGKNLTVTFGIKPTQDIVDGDTLTITVKVFGVALGHVDFNSCKDIGISCPFKAGTAGTISAVYDVPSAAPGGVPLTAEVTAKTSGGTQYSCVDVPVTMGKPPALRRSLVEPELNQAEQYIEQLLQLAETNPERLAKEMRESDLAAIAPTLNDTMLAAIAPTPTNGIPTVVAHGMGDSCFNPGMKSITTAIGGKTGAYSVCIPTGPNDIFDTINGFLKNMDDSIDLFAKKIKADKNLANGFNAAGFSQGNSLIRGYINKYNDPPVKSFLSVHGTVMGVSGVPQCKPSGLLSLVCEPLAKLCGTFGYTGLVQKHLFQADYFRDPTKLTAADYKKSQLAVLNNEGDTPNPDYKTNFGKTESFVMVKAMQDTMVYPNEGEHWGALADGSFKTVLPMKETTVYKEDTFGLKTADEAGKIKFETTAGNHLQFSETELFGWISKYW